MHTHSHTPFLSGLAAIQDQPRTTLLLMIGCMLEPLQVAPLTGRKSTVILQMGKRQQNEAATSLR